jgi:hypothetical protein
VVISPTDLVDDHVSAYLSRHVRRGGSFTVSTARLEHLILTLHLKLATMHPCHDGKVDCQHRFVQETDAKQSQNSNERDTDP